MARQEQTLAWAAITSSLGLMASQDVCHFALWALVWSNMMAITVANSGEFGTTSSECIGLVRRGGCLTELQAISARLLRGNAVVIETSYDNIVTYGPAIRIFTGGLNAIEVYGGI